MQNGIHVGITGQVAMENRLTTLANNIANTNTTGFRATEIRFDEVLKKVDDQRVSMVSKGQEFVSPKTGAIEKTGGTFDLAINGDAWFSVQTNAGNVMTKDGRFSLSAQGILTSIDGDPVLDAGGAPIEIDPAGGRVDIGSDGIIKQNGQTIGGVGLFSFNPGADFERYGSSGFKTNETTQPIVNEANVKVLQGYLEQSNVNPVEEITQLISVQRNFEQSSNLVEKSDESLKRLIQALHKG